MPRGLFEIGLGMCIPTMMAYAKPEQLDRYVRPALRGEEVWCQLFSEPAGGSDLAALRTRAERDGDDWIINGQKIWTSGAHLSDFGIIVVRTDPNVPKHEGLTFFFLDMKIAGHRDPADPSDVRRVATSTRCSSPMCACPMRSGWARWGRAGRSRSPR